MQTCSKCNSEAVFKQGTKKETGKPWSGYFCQNPECKNVDWTPKAGKTSPQPQNGAKINVSNIDPIKILSDEVMGLRSDFNDRMDKMAEYLKAKLG